MKAFPSEKRIIFVKFFDIRYPHHDFKFYLDDPFYGQYDQSILLIKVISPQTISMVIGGTLSRYIKGSWPSLESWLKKPKSNEIWLMKYYARCPYTPRFWAIITRERFMAAIHISMWLFCYTLSSPIFPHTYNYQLQLNVWHGNTQSTFNMIYFVIIRHIV